MTVKNKEMLSEIQIIILVISTIIGAGLLSLPRKAVESAGPGALIVVLISGIYAIGLTCIIAYLSSLFPGKTIFEYSQDIVGGIITKIITVILFLYFIFLYASIIRIFADTIKVYLLEDTPLEVITITMLALVSYLVHNGINSIARICEAFILILILSITMLLVLSFQNFDIRELYSFWQIDLKSLAGGILETGLSYFGMEVLLIVGAFAAQPNKILKNGVIGTSIAVSLYIAIVAISIGVFTIEGLRFHMYPSLELAKSIIFPGSFAERFDVLFAMSWIIAIFTSSATIYYSAVFSMTRLISLRNYKPFCYILMPLVYILSLIPKNIGEIIITNAWVSYFGIAVITIIPAFLLIVALIRKKGGAQSEKV